MPLAFFTHTQTGALTSRLNNDVIGAQRAVTGTLGSVVSNVISLVTTLVAMFLLNWRITLIAVAVLPLFLLPARRVGRRLQAITRESMQLNAAMNTQMTERFNVAGALLVKLFGRRDRELAGVLRPGRRGSATSAIRSALYGRTFFVALGLVGAIGAAAVYWVGAGWCSRASSRPATLVALAALRHPGLRPADRPDQRPGRRDDRVRVLRAGLRGARPAEPDRRPARGRPPRPPAGRRRVRPRRLPLPAGRASRPSPASPAGGRHRGGRRRAGAARRQLHASSPASSSPWSARPAPARSTTAMLVARALRRQRGRRAGRRPRRARPDAGEPAGRHRRGRPGPPPVPRHHPGQPALRQARRDRSRSSRPPAARPGSTT